MKIAYVCNEYPLHGRAGGIGIFTRAIAHGLVERGHDVTVVGYGKQSGEWRDCGVRVVVLPQSRTRGLAWRINRRRLYNWLKAESQAGNIDCVELPESQGLLPFRFNWCPVVVRLHTSRLLNRSHLLIRCLEKRTLAHHAHWIAVSRHVYRETVAAYGIEPRHTRVIYNPIPDTSPVGVDPQDLPPAFVLYAGTVSEHKGAFILAEAARIFLRDTPELHLVYVGGLKVENGHRADETIRRLLGDAFAARVHFTGLVEHDIVLAYMRRAKVFVFPSKLESFGLVPVEAMSCGVPVIYSNLHAGPEIIDDGVTGLLADPYSPEDVAQKVLRLLNDSALGAQLAKNALRAVETRFSLKRCIDATIAFYEHIVSGCG